MTQQQRVHVNVTFTPTHQDNVICAVVDVSIFSGEDGQKLLARIKQLRGIESTGFDGEVLTLELQERKVARVVARHMVRHLYRSGFDAFGDMSKLPLPSGGYAHTRKTSSSRYDPGA